MQQSSNDSNKHHRTLDEFRICNGGVRKISNSSVLLTGTTAEVILKKMAKEREGEWTCRRQMKKKNQRVNTNNINLIGDEIQMKKVKRTRIEEINVQNEQVKYKQSIIQSPKLQQQQCDSILKSKQMNEQITFKQYSDQIQDKDIQQEQNDDQYEFFDLERENQSENESEQENDSDIDNCVLAGLCGQQRPIGIRPNIRVLSDVEIVDLLYQICLGLDYLHSVGVIHCDLKGQNILLNHTLIETHYPLIKEIQSSDSLQSSQYQSAQLQSQQVPIPSNSPILLQSQIVSYPSSQSSFHYPYNNQSSQQTPFIPRLFRSTFSPLYLPQFQSTHEYFIQDINSNKLRSQQISANSQVYTRTYKFMQTRALISDFGQSMLIFADRKGNHGLIHKEKDSSIHITQHKQMHSHTGTVDYMSPELLRDPQHPCNEKSDIWSLGVCLYLMMFASLPFKGNSQEEITEKIIQFTSPNVPPKPNYPFIDPWEQEREQIRREREKKQKNNQQKDRNVLKEKDMDIDYEQDNLNEEQVSDQVESNRTSKQQQDDDKSTNYDDHSRDQQPAFARSSELCEILRATMHPQPHRRPSVRTILAFINRSSLSPFINNAHISQHQSVTSPAPTNNEKEIASLLDN